MTIPELQSLIAHSALLADKDRAYWLSALPSMHPDQIGKLEKILSAGENIHIEDKVKEYFATTAQVASHPPLAA